MMKVRNLSLLKKLTLGVCFSALLAACGGSSGSPSASPAPIPAPTPTPTPAPTPAPAPAPLPVVSVRSSDDSAYEKNNDFAKFVIERTGELAALSVPFDLSGSSEPDLGSAQASDYVLMYADGGAVGSEIEFGQNQSARIIEVQPVLDELNEVRETLTLNLQSHSTYTLASDNAAQVYISDALSLPENAKVFLGVFGPEEGAVTTASGTLSLILAGDNMSASLSYRFSGLTSEQTDQHIHLSPSGTVLKDIRGYGNVLNYDWDLAPGGPFVNRQQQLDALFAGEIYINIHTANYPRGEISAFFNFNADVAPPTQGALTEEEVDQDIIRFLTQATFGPTPEAFEALKAQISADGENRLAVYERWIDNEISKPASSKYDLTELIASLESDDTRNSQVQDRRDAFWMMAAFSKDQLRQKMAYALSQILVVSDESAVIRRAYRGASSYWDMLAENAFGQYNETLLDVTLHPVMGVWLSHIKNRKADPEQGFFPDENYAREIMQLFSFGLVHRNIDGSIRLGANNLPEPTYDNDVIEQMARVFTGLSFSASQQNQVEAPNNRFNLFEGTNNAQYRWIRPMKFFAEHHEFGEKVLFTDNGSTLVIPAATNQTAETAQAELEQVINAIVAHRSTAPNISRLLIQRFVTSNPSGEYIARVANAFGENGDLAATLKAILLDPEARSPVVARSETFGKAKEPILHLTSAMRLLDVGSSVPLGAGENGLEWDVAPLYDDNATLLKMPDLALGQRALGASSVFNFYLPDFSPAGSLSVNGLVAPELQLLSESQLYTSMNIVHIFMRVGLIRWRIEDRLEYSKEQLMIRLSRSELEEEWNATDGTNAEKAEAVVDYLDFYLNAGQLRATNNMATRAALINAIASAGSMNERAELAIYGVMTSPEFLIQR